MIELEHSPLGGSSAARFMACAGSFQLHRDQLENGEFEDVPSEYAALGVAAHALAAKCLEENAEPYEFIGEDFGDGPTPYRAGWEGEISLDAVQVYFNECRAILDAADGKGATLIETTIHLPEIHPLLKGTVDFGWWSKTKGIFLRDYKNGEGVGVSAVNNVQLLYYASLMLLASPYLRDNAPRDLPVNLGIVQPNFYGLYEAPEVWETTAGFVMDWFQNELLPRMNDLVATRDVSDADFISGTHCQFCPVMLECPTMQRAYEAYAAGSEDFVTMLTNEEIDKLYAMREDARRFMKALESTAHARMVAGATIKSAKLVEKQVARVWKPGGTAAIQAAFGEKAWAPRKVLSPAAIEKLSSRGKELALEYGYKPDSEGLVIAPLSDRRPEAKRPGNAGVFSAHAQSNEEAGW